MKTILGMLLLAASVQSFAQNVDFKKIFAEIRAARTTDESIEIRRRYLGQMSSLRDFDRLTDLESLEPGEQYFDSYKKSLAKFTLDNVDRFMLDRQSDDEQDIYARRITAKSYNYELKFKFLEKGLFYVDDCDDFKSFLRMSKAPAQFSSRYQREYCSTQGGNGNPTGNGGNTFELISNLTLKAGEYKIIYLPSYMYISKLYVSVNGLRSDTYFDLMVNGDIKGTIYAPGRDPLYIINVQDSANSINLRSMFGDAYISSIKVEQ